MPSNDPLHTRIEVAGASTFFRELMAGTLPAAAQHDGTHDTPLRAAKAWFEKTDGYRMNAQDVLKLFEVPSEQVRGMVVVRDIEIESMCEHHLERIWGVVHIGYVPKAKVLGLSKFSRLVDVYARRLQVQERLTAEIADALWEGLRPEGVGVVIEARHACMEARGIRRRGQVTITSELRGCMYGDPTARAEFLALAQTKGAL